MRRTVTAAVAFTLALSASDVGAQSTDTATALPPAEDARLADEPVAKDDPFFRSIGRDFKRFFTTTDTVRTIGHHLVKASASVSIYLSPGLDAEERAARPASVMR